MAVISQCLDFKDIGRNHHESTGVELSLALEKIQIILGDDREGRRQYPVPSAQDRRIH